MSDAAGAPRVTERTVELEIEGPLARITLNRPEKLNAMNLAWCRDLEAAVEAAAAERDVRVVLVRGAGRAFCAGLDRDMLDRDGMPAGFFEHQERALRGLETMDKIAIAALHGYCLGGGLQLAIACDIRIAGSDCRLGLPAGELGLFPGMAPFRLPRLIGLGPARRIVLFGQVLGADEALSLGLVDHVVPAERFEAEVSSLVESYLSLPPAGAAASKRLLASSFEAPFERAFEEAVALLADCLSAPEVEAAREAWRRHKARRQGG